MATKAQQWAEENSEELHAVLEEVGASQMMHDLVDVRVPHRHSVVEELHKWQNGESTMDEAVRTAMRLGGGFFQKVADGEVAEAFMHADSNNQRVIAEAYTRERVMADADGDYYAGIVDERWPSQ